MSSYRLVRNHCPCNPKLAPYLELIFREAGVSPNSVYRGSDAAAILHRHGQHTQAEIHRAQPGTSNPEGQSTHDGHKGGAYPGPKTAPAEWWQQGFDVNDNVVDRVIVTARRHGWTLFRPYPRGAEHHHLNFKHKPRPRNAKDRFNLVWLRARMPKR